MIAAVTTSGSSSAATTGSSSISLTGLALPASSARKGSARIKKTDKVLKAGSTSIAGANGSKNVGSSVCGLGSAGERSMGSIPGGNKPITKIEHLCTLCQFSTRCSLELNDHLKQHLSDSESTPQKCTFCTLKAESLEALYEHVGREHHREKESLTRMLTAFKCSLCGLQASDYSTLSGHSCGDDLIASPGTAGSIGNVAPAASSGTILVPPIGLDPSEPVPASGVYPNPDNHSTALSSDTTGGTGGSGTQYACDFCPYITFNVGSFHRHRNKHKSAPAIKCVYCGRPMISKCAYESHVARQHVESLLGTIRQNMEGQCVRCMFCDEPCAPKQLNKHIDVVHQNAKNCLLDRSKAQKV